MDRLVKHDENQDDDVVGSKAKPTEPVLTPAYSLQKQLDDEEKETKIPVSLSTTGSSIHSNLNNADSLFNEIHNNDVIFPYDLHGELTEYFLEKAAKTLRETPESREKALTEMTKLVKDKELDASDALMLCFLRMKKFDVNLALEKMESFLNFTESHNMSESSCLDDISHLINWNTYHICPIRDEEGRFVLICKLRRYDPAQMKRILHAAARLIMRIMDEPANQIAGTVLIMDCEGLSWQWLKRLSISNLLMGYHVYFKCSPLRYQQVHIINDNGMAHYLLKLVGVLLSSKMKNRIYVHGKDLDSLYKFVPKYLLPAEYGGTGYNWKIPYTLEDVVQIKLLSTS